MLGRASSNQRPRLDPVRRRISTDSISSTDKGANLRWGLRFHGVDRLSLAACTRLEARPFGLGRPGGRGRVGGSPSSRGKVRAVSWGGFALYIEPWFHCSPARFFFPFPRTRVAAVRRPSPLFAGLFVVERARVLPPFTYLVAHLLADCPPSLVL
ncbi:hypothetical protein BS50DRAFT_404748 [Corynespora cassiicola Philippines]|uniref:Uncharacterized protein n=1 Tax=Corynespora cassiicola Philippines TaxID=1448308 RepID=A0A2T2NKT2_CORCC|nr:hypothetical protein BS50DRAFT_404748 [Corynespora cassiicola Philippines]